MNGDKEQAFVERMKAVLDEAGRQLDPVALTRLRKARRRALEQREQRPAASRPRWLLPAAGLALAGVAVAVIGLLWFTVPGAGNGALTDVDNLDLLTARDSPEFYAEIDFYQWLVSRNDAG